MNYEVDIDIDVPFDKGQAYIVGYDTLGDGVEFDVHTSVCCNREDLNDEAVRVFLDHELYADLEEGLTVKELLVIAKIINPKIKLTEWEVDEKRKKINRNKIDQE